MNADAGHQPTAKEHLRRLNPGEPLFRQGDPAVAIFRLESGQIHLLRHTEDGASVLMHVARPGETFAEAVARMGSTPSQLWRSSAAEGWSKPPAVWCAWSD